MKFDSIPLASPGARYLAHKEEYDNAVHHVLERGVYILGGEVAAFEKSFAAYIGVPSCVGVASGTDAISLALMAVGVGVGDEVITVSHTAVATVAAIEQTGAMPVFADIETDSLCLDPKAIPSLLSEKTKAIVVVHIYGQPAAMEKILKIARDNKLIVIEDCAQACGAEINGRKCGAFGDVSAFSFYPTKNLGAIGDGGAVLTASPSTAEIVRGLRQYGWRDRYVSEFPGTNSRLDEIQAAILNVGLRHLDAGNKARQEIAAQYTKSCDTNFLQPPAQLPGRKHAMHLYVVQSETRTKFEEFMKERGIGVGRHYPVPVHEQPAYSKRIRGYEKLSCTDDLYRKIVTLPLYPELSEDAVNRVSNAIREWCCLRKYSR